MTLHAAGNERDAPRYEQAAGAVLHELAGALERRERGIESAPLAPANVEAISELVGGERRSGAVQRVENLATVFGIRSARPLGAAAAPKRCFSGLLL
jgi:hypothetical protein